MKNIHSTVDIDDLSTWTKYHKRLCKTCRANCCTMPVEVKLKDLVQMELITRFEAGEPIKKIAARLKKEGIIDHFYFKERLFTLMRFANGDCLYLDPDTRQCRIYEKRPDTCRRHPHVGPRPGFCAYEKRL